MPTTDCTLSAHPVTDAKGCYLDSSAESNFHEATGYVGSTACKLRRKVRGKLWSTLGCHFIPVNYVGGKKEVKA